MRNEHNPSIAYAYGNFVFCLFVCLHGSALLMETYGILLDIHFLVNAML